MHVTVFPSRSGEAVKVKLRFPAPLVLLSAGKESWACGAPPTHRQWYCRSTLFTDCREHVGTPGGFSVQREN